MATKALLMTRLKNTVRDGSVEDSELLSFLNEAVNRVAGGIRMPDNSLSPPLPDLLTSSTVTATTTQTYVAMPTNFQRHLFWVYSASSTDRIPFHDSLLGILNGDAAYDDTGQIETCVRKGNTLYYYPKPSTAETLTLRYYKAPTDMSADADTPNGVPAHLHYAVIIPYAAREILITLDPIAYKDRIAYHDAEFYRAMSELVDYVGYPETEPVNAVDHCVEDEY